MADDFLVMPKLRDYQIDAVDRARLELLNMDRPQRLILQASTGAGKSVIGLYLTLLAYQKGKRVLFAVSGRALVNQFETHLAGSNVPFGVIMAGRGRNKDAPVQLASKETLAVRGLKNGTMKLPHADLVVIDECHESMARQWRQLIGKYESAVVVGLSATPALGNGSGLGDVWNGMVKTCSTSKLVEQGWLVTCKVFAPDIPNLKGVKFNAKTGDYVRRDLSRRMDRPKITGSVVENWKRHADGRRSVVFACTIEHAKNLCQEFNSAGIPFRHVDQETPDEERAEIFGLIRDRKVMGFTNVSVARRGLDLPCLECACIVRPTRSLVLWLQMIGRIRRPAEGKTDSVVIDHAGACDLHCMPDTEIEWSLDSKQRASDWLQKQKDSGKIERQIVCPTCACMFAAGPVCPNCGHKMQASERGTRKVEAADGILVERTERHVEMSIEEMQRHWNKCIAIAVNKGRTLGMAAHVFAQRCNGKLPWQVPGLDYLPTDFGAWKKPAEESFPGFKRVKVKS